MAFRHGVYTSELPTSILPARSVDSNVVFAVGTAAVDRLETGKPRYVNRLRMYYSYDEFVSEMGWDEENFNKYSLQELAYSHFALYRGAPLVVCNVFDPAVHKTSVSSEAVSFDAKGAASLKHGSVSKLVLKNAESSTTYVEGTDYTLDPISGELSRIEGGSLPAEANVTAGYDYADVSLVDSTDVIGGINESTGESEGLELIDSVFPQFRLVPGSILAPRFSEDPAVAVVMAAKADGINGLFKAVALADIPTEGEHGVKKYTDVPAYKQNNNLSDELLIVCWPKVKLGDRVFGLATHLTGLISQTDADREGVPYASPSNKRLEITSIGYPDEKEEGGWKELFLGLDKCNYLNGEGIYTAVNWDGGMKSWGGRMSAYPSNTDPKDCQDAIRRFFNWYQSTFILTYFQKVDKPGNTRLIQSIVDSQNIIGNGYVARDYCAGYRTEFKSDENPITNLLDGHLTVHTYLAPYIPAEYIENIREYDTEALEAALTGGGE